MTFEELRERHPVFTYNGYTYELNNNELHIQFDFQIDNDIRFQPHMVLQPGIYAQYPTDLKVLDGIIFNIGMIELISYWKCACSPIIHIKPYKLDYDQQLWWAKLYWKGLGEFTYKNNIHCEFQDFIEFTFNVDAPEMSKASFPRISDGQRIIVPVGGGKDSVVTLEDLRQQRDVVPFIINPRGATLDCAKTAGFGDPSQIIILKREIAPKLLELNKEGYLNGHTPFSAMLAFYSTLLSAVTGIRDIALSNESSANEPTIPGTYINHQYSKSLEFEVDFRQYVQDHMNDCNHYYSHLRQLTELQIAERFARYPQYYKIFKSCNAGSKENKWCCNCPKCLFAYIILSPFIDDKTMIEIFGEDLLNKKELESYFDELSGISKYKPFECVGTIREVNEALRRICESRADKYLIKHYINEQLGQIEDSMYDEYLNMAP
ncbi:MAG: hypothetical protein MJZ57_06395 [Bacteroidales bacterium]|nr:hypothetical protein [Bacteroidales bacterium]